MKHYKNPFILFTLKLLFGAGTGMLAVVVVLSGTGNISTSPPKEKLQNKIINSHYNSKPVGGGDRFPHLSQDSKHSQFQRLNFLGRLASNPKLDIGVNIISQTGKFGRSFKELFRLSDTEVNDIEGKIRTLRQEYGEMTLSKAEISEAPGAITIDIPPLEDGPVYYDRFMDMMKSILGTERFPVFVQLADKQVMALFDGFGSESKTIELKYSGAHLSDGSINVAEHTKSGSGFTSQWYSLKNYEEFQGRFEGFDDILKNKK